jgi:membrane protease YdiL (CAAX protease family)
MKGISMFQFIKALLKTCILLFLGLFLMTLRPSLALILQKSNVIANFYLREGVAFGIAIIVLSLAIIIAGRGKYDTFGFTKPRGFRPMTPLLIALIAGAGSTVLGSLLKLKSPDILGNMTFPQIILSIWIVASIYEEMVVRGFIQGTLDIILRNSGEYRLLGMSLPVLISGIFFGLSHLMLFSMGATVGFVLIVVTFATVIGLTTAYYKEKTGSLLSAILIHMVANIAGGVAGHFLG